MLKLASYNLTIFLMKKMSNRSLMAYSNDFFYGDKRGAAHE